MKYIIFLLVAVFFSQVAQAQVHYMNSGPHPPAHPLRLAGIITAGVGVCTVGAGLLYTALDQQSFREPGNDNSNYNTRNTIITIGGGLIVTGIVLILVDGPNKNKKKLSLIAPKRNELGIAFNF